MVYKTLRASDHLFHISRRLLPANEKVPGHKQIAVNCGMCDNHNSIEQKQLGWFHE